MADVLLRDNVNELRGHVRDGRYSDAVALGQHILHYFPKHIETYRLLAEASLESNDLSTAADLFYRVRSADPENIVALIGLSIISESQNQRDQAIWYLERAFEIQPTNPELRNELLRLYAEEEPTPRPRLKLTPGGLARLYAREGLLAQAIEEFRRLLRADSTRVDLQVALAEMLYRAGRTDEAGQVAQSILEQFPFCLKANLVLGKLWSENEVPQAETLWQRAQALDPDNSTARELFGNGITQSAPPHLPRIGEEPSPATTFESLVDSRESLVDFGESAEGRGESEFEATDLREREPPSDLEESMLLESLSQQLFTSDGSALVEPTAPATDEAVASADAVTTAPSADETLAPPSPRVEVEPASPAISEVASPTVAQPQTGFPVDTSMSFEQTPRSTVEDRREAEGPSLTEKLAAIVRPIETQLPPPASTAITSPPRTPTVEPPLRRARPALPRVRPTIPGALAKLPAWIRGAKAIAPAETIAPGAEAITSSVAPAEAMSTPDVEPEGGVTVMQPVESLPPISPDKITPLTTPAAFNAPSELARTDELPAPSEPMTIATDEAQAEPEWLARLRDAARSGDWSVGELEDSSTGSGETSEAANTRIAGESAHTPSWLSVESPTITEPPPSSEQIESLPQWLQQATDVTTVEPEQTDAAETHAAVQSSEQGEDETTLVQVELAGSAQVESVQGAHESAGESPIPFEEKALPDPKALLTQARELVGRGDTIAAVEAYEKVFQRAPGLTNEVIADLEQLVSKPNVPKPAHRLLGDAYTMVGRFKEAVEQYRVVLSK